MKLSLLLSLLAISWLGFSSKAQNVFINEVSQGPSGNKEYVELIVVGQPNCQNPQPCLDMRGIIIDDNNGYFASGNGKGIAQGAMRFADNQVWACVPIGTIIVIYNNQDRNALIPADDPTDINGDFVRIVPGNSSLFDRHTSLPVSNNSSYSTTGWVSGGNWQNQLAMAGDNDSFQIRESVTSSAPSHAVSWGNNSQNNIIYFAGSASGKVFNMDNVVNNDPSLQANWVSEDCAVSGTQTPGAANSSANGAWIESLRNGSSGSNLDATVTNVDSGCGAACTGSASITVTGGVAPYTYAWSNAATSAAISNLCAGDYSVEVTDALGCTVNKNVTIAGSSSNIVATVSTVNDGCSDDCTGSATVAVNGGVAPYTYSWSNGSTSSAINNLCEGIYEITITDNSGCTATAQGSVGTTQNTMELSTITTTESCADACDGTASVAVTGGMAPYSYLWSTGATNNAIGNLCDATYTVTVTDNNGCVSTRTAIVNAGAAGVAPVITPVGVLSLSDQPIQLQSSIQGGTWASNCGTCLSQNGVFDPQIAGEGTYQICYSIGANTCVQNTCINIQVSNGCVDVVEDVNMSICPGKVIVHDGVELSAAGNHPFIYTLPSGCDSSYIIHLSIYNTFPTNESYTGCIGDTVEVNGDLFTNSQMVYYETVDSNGCILQNSMNIVLNDCEEDEYLVFIPNTFTPNNDGVNDVFMLNITGGELVKGFILNRWGQIVHEFSADHLEWDGLTEGGKMSPDGVYTYTVEVQQYAGVRHAYHGHVTLIR